MKNLKLFVILSIVSICLASKVPCSTKKGFIGTCRSITDCDYITDQLENNGDFTDLTPCSSDGTVGIFCCPEIPSSEAPSILGESCRKIIQLKQQLLPNITSYNKQSKTVAVGELPFTVQVMFPEKGFVGAGVLISEKFVLSSAHVVFIRQSMPTVRIGKTTLDDDDGVVGIDLKVKQVIPHELYIPREKYYDVALLMLARAVKFYNHIWPACLHNSKIVLKDDETFTVSGWKSDGKKTNSMIKNFLKPIESSKCQTFYNSKKFLVPLPNGITDNLFCGKFTDCEVGAVSDGPVFVHVNDTTFIYGFTGDFETDCNSSRPGMFMKISEIAEWIESIIL